MSAIVGPPWEISRPYEEEINRIVHSDYTQDEKSLHIMTTLTGQVNALTHDYYDLEKLDKAKDVNLTRYREYLWPCIAKLCAWEVQRLVGRETMVKLIDAYVADPCVQLSYINIGYLQSIDFGGVVIAENDKVKRFVIVQFTHNEPSGHMLMLQAIVRRENFGLPGVEAQGEVKFTIKTGEWGHFEDIDRTNRVVERVNAHIDIIKATFRFSENAGLSRIHD